MQQKPTQLDRPLTVGILALQGAYEAHAKTLQSLGVTTKLIRTPGELTALDGKPTVDGLIIPGGESTTMLKFLERNQFLDAPTPLAKDAQQPAPTSLAAMAITVEPNAYGRQIASAILTAPTKLEGAPLEMVFIRAPRITRTGPHVETLATRDGFPVLVREGHLLAATFHPELSSDTRVHQLFLNLISQNLIRKNAPALAETPQAQPH